MGSCDIYGGKHNLSDICHLLCYESCQYSPIRIIRLYTQIQIYFYVPKVFSQESLEATPGEIYNHITKL